MFFCFFGGIQFLAFFANRYKNLKNGRALGSFFKYSPNSCSRNFDVRKSVKRKFIPVLFSWYFFHYVNDRYTVRYYMQRYIKTFSNNETIKYKHQTTFNNEFLCSERIFHSFGNFFSIIDSLLDYSLFKSLQNQLSSPCICSYKSTIQLAWSGFKSDNFYDTLISVALPNPTHPK